MVRRPTVPPGDAPDPAARPAPDPTGRGATPAPGGAAQPATPDPAGRETSATANRTEPARPETQPAADREREPPEAPPTRDEQARDTPATEAKETPATPKAGRRTRIEPVGRAPRKAAAAETKPAASQSHSASARAARDKAAAEAAAAAKAEAELKARLLEKAAAFVKGPFEFVRPPPEGGGGGGDPVALSDYLAVLRREIARAGLEGTSDEALPMVGIAEAEITLGCVAVGLREDRLFIDPSWKALAEAPQAAVQRLRVRLVDADMTAALRPKE